MPTNIASTLYELRKDACHIEFVRPCPADWAPIPNHCHENAGAWVTKFHDSTVVHGWLLISEDEESGTAMFCAHSIVRDAQNHLWDVTQEECNKFLVHPGDSIEFMERVRSGEWTQVFYIPGTSEDTFFFSDTQSNDWSEN